VENTTHDPKEVRLAKYHPDIPTIRKNYAHYHDAVERMDDQVGHFLKQLTRMELMENTIVIYNSDHGGVLPRSKRHLFNSGTHCPLIIRIPEKYRAWWPADTTGSKSIGWLALSICPRPGCPSPGQRFLKLCRGKFS
jgi:membrane-anchored protein YejM (alkaline phosphatase superfamily)